MIIVCFFRRNDEWGVYCPPQDCPPGGNPDIHLLFHIMNDNCLFLGTMRCCSLERNIASSQTSKKSHRTQKYMTSVIKPFPNRKIQTIITNTMIIWQLSTPVELKERFSWIVNFLRIPPIVESKEKLSSIPAKVSYPGE